MTTATATATATAIATTTIAKTTQLLWKQPMLQLLKVALVGSCFVLVLYVAAHNTHMRAHAGTGSTQQQQQQQKKTYVGRNVRQQGRVTTEELELLPVKDTDTDAGADADAGAEPSSFSSESSLSLSSSLSLAARFFVRRNLGGSSAIPIAMETKTIAHKPKSTANELYKTTYHYTTPKQQATPTPTALLDRTGDSEQKQKPPQRQRQYFLKDSVHNDDNDDDDVFHPRIAWLASFPNSGTSFTMTMVARATNTTFATNYGIEASYGSRDKPSLPIYPRHPEGPYMPDPETSVHHRQLPYQGGLVLTKTHCGGYCVNCGPDEYAYGYDYGNDHGDGAEGATAKENDDYSTDTPQVTFLQDCASGHAIDRHQNLVDVSYPPERVARVVHLIRNPFHNVIARFHLERKHHNDANTTNDRAWLALHPDNAAGLDRFCSEQNDERRGAEDDFFGSAFFGGEGSAPASGASTTTTSTSTDYARRNGDHRSSTESGFSTAANYNYDIDAASTGTSTGTVDWHQLVDGVPCRGDFFRYVQWHNLLHQSLDYVPHKLPVLTVYYESYASATFPQTAAAVLDFLNLEPVAGDKRGNVKWAEFRSRTDYDNFFSPRQRATVREFLQTLASFRVWGEIEHYFERV